ncbi:MAG: TonB-dependent receptor [Pseudomonadota bacterium]|nr:TonB-dependent receptor [Pseudomonadota bacterium]
MNRLLLPLVAMATGHLAIASAEEQPLELDPVTITAEPFANRGELESTRPVDVLVGDALERARAATLGETLDQQPGIANAGFGPGAGRVVIRGQSGPRVRVLDGGVGVMDASTVSPDHNISTEPFRAQQIEILRGPAALLYGNGAIGGVVNVVSDTIPTEPVEQLSGSLGMRYDDGTEGLTTFGHSEFSLGRLNLHIDGLIRDTNELKIPSGAAQAPEEAHEEEEDAHEDEDVGQADRLENSGTATESFAVGSSWVDDWGFVGVAVTRYDTHYGVPGHAHGHEETHEEEGEHEDEAHEEEAEGGVRIDLKQTRYDAKFELFDPVPGFSRLRGALVVSEYAHTELEPSGEPGTVFGNDGTELRLEATHAPMGALTGVLGIQWVDSDFSAIGEEAFVPTVQTRSLGLFGVEEWELNALRLEAGLRLERTDHDPSGGQPARDYSTVSLSLGGNYTLGDHANVAVSLSRSQRAPSSQELYSLGPHLATETFEVGNLDLTEEIANNLDVTLHWHGDRVDAELTGFITRYQDYIYQSTTDALLPDGEPDRVDEEGMAEADGELLYVSYTQQDAHFVGAEASLSVLALQSTTLGHWRPRVFADTVSGELDNGGPLPRITPSRIGLGLDWQRLSLGADLRLTRVLTQDDTAELETETAGYTRLDADLTWTVRSVADLVFGLRARNLLDETVRDHTSFIKNLSPGVGRSIIVDMALEF